MLLSEINPIKRSAALAPLSREHHEDLLLAWKIRAGIRKGISCQRMVNYCLWFYTEHMIDHFRKEEQYFPTLVDSQDALLLQMIKEHKDIRLVLTTLSYDEEKGRNNLEEFASILTNHVRFEERLLYNHIERLATEEQLQALSQNLSAKKLPDWKDQFWLS